MILALVFLLFTSFVGSTVLVSATANAYRVKHLADQQDFLTERSAALLMTDQLQLEDDQRLQLIVVDASLLYKEATVGDGGVVQETGDTFADRIITFQVVTNIAEPNPMQKLQLEMAVWRYLEEEGIAPNSHNVVLRNFLQGESTDAFAFKPSASATAAQRLQGAMTVTAASKPVTFQADKGAAEQNLPGTGVSIPNYTANFSCGSGDDLYDFFIVFASGNQLKVNVNAFYGKGNPNIIESPARQGTPAGSGFTTGFYTLTTTSVQTVISWEDPMLEKGGAL